MTPLPPLLLFVCTANICRSAFAEVLARHRFADSGWRFASAGVHGRPGHPVSEEMAEELRVRGIAPEGFASRALTRQMVEEADLVLTAEAAHRRWVLEEVPAAVTKTFSVGQFLHATEAVEVVPGLALPELLGRFRTAAATASDADDIPDPYRRGRPAAELAAELLEDAVVRTMGALLSVKSHSTDTRLTE